MSVTVKIENCYSDGHESKHEVVLPSPRGSLDEWFEDEVFPHTGDGHGIDQELGYCHTATIIATDTEEHLGAEYEWCGS